jgi:uncharacterized damage-inducible protein DinB
MHPKTLAHQLGLCSYVLERNLSELSEQESHVAPQAGGSCVNWVLGHITRTRLEMLRGLGKELPFPLEEFNAYDDRGGVRFTRATAIPTDELKRRYKALQEPLVRALNELPPDIMDRPATFSPTANPKETMGTLLAAFAFHEAYHAGQTGLLRRVAGKAGAIKPAAATAAR